MAKVTTKNLTKTFSNTASPKELNTGVTNKSFLVLLKSSIYEKTAMLMCTARLETPIKKEIHIRERAVNDLRLRQRCSYDISKILEEGVIRNDC